MGEEAGQQDGKICSKCHIWKPYSHFHKGNRKGGRRSECVMCALRWHKLPNVKKQKSLYDKKYCSKPSVREKRKAFWQTEIGIACKLNDTHKRRLAKDVSDIDTSFLIQKRKETIICVICDLPLLSTDKVHLDHIIPIGMGGTHTKNNVRYVHSSCNLKRPKNGSDEITLQISA